MRFGRRLPSRVVLLPLLLGVLALGFWLNGIDRVTLTRRLLSANALWVAAMLLITTSWLFVRFIRWQYLLRRAGIRVPIRPSLSVYLAGLPGTVTPAYVGEVIRGAFLRRRFGAPLGVSTVVLVLERLFDVAALGVVLCVSASDATARKIGLAFLATAAVAAVLLAPIARRAGVTDASLARLRSWRTLAPASVLSLGAWMCAALLVPVGAMALGETIEILPGMAVFARATLLGALTLLPAGIGATGGLTIVGLDQIRVGVTSAIALVSLIRLTSTAFTVLVGVAFFWREVSAWRHSSAEPPPLAPAHFDEIAGEYNAQWAPHVWDLLIRRKLDLMSSALPASAHAGRGLDLGCGLGLQVAAMSERGFQVVGIDPSWGLLAEGRARGHQLLAGDALALPFADCSFDFAYCIGVLHHLPGREAQQRAYAEIERVLKPGGVFLVHESNPRNPLFRFYMGYLFPILKSIDEGTEWWIDSTQPGASARFRRETVRYFTWFPDFTPRALMPLVLRIEKLLERGPFHHFSAHYMAVLRKS